MNDPQMEIITENRLFLEKLVLGSFLRDLTAYKEYKVSVDDFMYDESIFFFSLGRAMAQRYTELDEHTVYSFIKDSKKELEQYEKYGGWNKIEEFMEIANVNNTESYIDDLAKNNLLINLREKGFNITEDIYIDDKKINPFKRSSLMNAKEVEQFYEGLLSKCSVESISQQVKMESLIITKDIMDKLKEHENAGTPYDIMFSYTEKEIGISDSEDIKYIYSLPILSGITNGLKSGGGNTEILAHSGQGKSTITFFNFLLPMIYRGESCIIISNEQKVEYFRTMLYTFIASNIFKYYNLTRKKMTNGDFNQKEEQLIHQISDFLKRREFDENLKFISMEEFNVDEIMRFCKPLITHKGFSTILIDTMKAQDSSASNYVGAMSEAVKRLDYYGNKYNVKIIMTQQLTSNSEGQNAYLTAGEISECKSVKNVADVLLLMRTVVNELELDSKNKDWYLRPYKLVKTEFGKWRKKYITFTEDDIKNNQYRLIFVNKNRSGETGGVLLLKFEGHTGRFIELGLCEHVSRKTLVQSRRY